MNKPNLIKPAKMLHVIFLHRRLSYYNNDDSVLWTLLFHCSKCSTFSPEGGVERQSATCVQSYFSAVTEK